MSDSNASFKLVHEDDQHSVLMLSGAWVQGSQVQDFAALSKELHAGTQIALLVDGTALDEWDSTLMAFMLQCYNYCSEEGIDFATRALPSGAQKLLTLATAPTVKPARSYSPGGAAQANRTTQGTLAGGPEPEPTGQPGG